MYSTIAAVYKLDLWWDPTGSPFLPNSKWESEEFPFFAGEETTQISLYFILNTYMVVI